MPKVRRSRKPPPDGWELIEPTLEELEQKMREGQSIDLVNERKFLYQMKVLVTFSHFLKNLDCKTNLGTSI